MTDTVGFIRKLPHHLVEAFKSTLKEAIYADIIIHVVDASNPQMDTQMYVVYETLRQLGVKEKPIVTLFNKQDQVETPGAFRDFQADYTVCTSARTGEGLEELKQVLLEILRKIWYMWSACIHFPRREESSGFVRSANFWKKNMFRKEYK